MRILLSNKKFNLNYFSIEEIEAGISLKGSEVKSLILANASIDQSFITFKKNEACIINMYIAPYKGAKNVNNFAESRSRKLLLHKDEIIRIQYLVKKKRLTLIPKSVYLQKNKIKILICLVKSKKNYDKREENRKKDMLRESKKYQY